MVKLLQNVKLLLVSTKTISKYIEMLFPTNHLLCSNILEITDGLKDQRWLFIRKQEVNMLYADGTTHIYLLFRYW